MDQTVSIVERSCDRAAIRASKFVVVHSIEDTPVCDEASTAPLKLVALSDINVEMRPLRARSLFKAAINASIVKSVTASK
ncbi:hypothetical protein TNCV_3368211 [Trichonephila clavipes]|nr:hypothetical protein TNCV_3368211 [Trichonephila clavipes]